MSLEVATYISDLVATNPTSTDPKSQGDDHLRLIKSTLQASFTGVTGAVTASQTELNYLDGLTVGVQQKVLSGVVTGGDFTTTSTSLTGVLGMSVSLEANATYRFDVVMNAQNSTVNGLTVALQFNSGGGGAGIEAQTTAVVSGSTVLMERVSAFGVASSTLGGVAALRPIKISGVIVTTVAASLIVQVAVVTSGTVTVKERSALIATRLA